MCVGCEVLLSTFFSSCGWATSPKWLHLKVNNGFSPKLLEVMSQRSVQRLIQTVGGVPSFTACLLGRNEGGKV